MGFSRQEYWGGLPFPSPGDLPNSGVEPGSPTLQADALPAEPQGSLSDKATLFGDGSSHSRLAACTEVWKYFGLKPLTCEAVSPSI